MAPKTKVKKTKPKLLQMRDDRTGLLIGSDTQLIINDDKDARKAIEAAGKLIEEIDKIRAKGNLSVLEAEYENIRKSLRVYQSENDIDGISSGGWASSFVQRKKSFWVWSKNDLPENVILEDEVVPLQVTLKRKFRDLKKRNKIVNRVTRRVVIPAVLDDLVREGVLKPEDIQDSYAEYIETSYVQIKPIKK